LVSLLPVSSAVPYIVKDKYSVGALESKYNMVDQDTKKYAIDVRIFLATMTTAMVLAFGVGVSLGPDPIVPSNLSSVDQFETTPEVQKVEYPASGLSDAESPHEPAGQHLLVDIKGIEAAFLDSEERLSQAMVDAVKAGGLSMLSYHCHKLIPAGVSCVGVLLESHISFHTWPDEGVITLDLFTCGPKSLLPVVKDVERLFAIGENTKTYWSHELRGFRLNENRTKSSNSYLADTSDLGFWVMSPLDLEEKNQIVSVKSPIQQIDIWDIKEVDDTPGQQDALKYDLQPGDPRWLTHELVTPDRLLFLDGSIQSISSTEKEYHEALVQPVMFTHPNPRNIVILGGGEGAVLREVLKHKTVESVVMIEVDEMLVDIARKHLPNMSNCADLVGRSDSCFDDELASVVYEDSRQWFMDRYGPNPTKEAKTKFDVVIMDALDPEARDTVSEDLYSDADFIASLLSSLAEGGIIVSNAGVAPTIHDPRADLGVFSNRELFINLFEESKDVGAVMVYEEAHCGFLEPHSFLVVCNNSNCRSRWLRESAVFDYDIYDRIVGTKSSERPFIHYDGTTHHSYRAPPKAWETVYCRREPTPFECDYIWLDNSKEIHDYDFEDEEKSSFYIDYEDDDVTAESIQATVDIPKGSYIMPNHLASSFIIDDESLNNLEHLTKDNEEVNLIEDLVKFIDENGHRSVVDGIGKTYVEVGASFLIEDSDEEGEINVGRWMPRKKRPVYSPVYDRHYLSFDLFLVATKDIMKGEYLVRPKNLWEDVLDKKND